MHFKPKSIRLDAATACQLRCPSCSTGTGQNKASAIGMGYLSKEHFLRFLKDAPWVNTVELSNWGEIFLNKDITHIFRIAHERNVRLTASNGVNLNTCSDEALEACVKYKVFRLTCSIDGASQESYAKYRIGGHFDTVIRNVEKINFYKRKYRSVFPKLKWQFVIFGHNEHELPQAREMAKSLQMEFRPKLSWDESFSPVKDHAFVRKHSGIEQTSRSEYKKKKGKDYKRSICSQLWEKPQINFDGSLLGCCVNTWQPFGNVLKEGVEQALNNSSIQRARNMLLGLAEESDDIACTHCKKFKDMKRSQHWLRPREVARWNSLYFYIVFWQQSFRRIAGFPLRLKRLLGIRARA